MSDDLLAQLQTSLGDAYAIERELGGGGMSRVFLAVEKALGRRVVLKVLSPDLAAGVSAQRFSREVRLAASLQQANIVPVLATGESNGLPYYTMPFVDGLSLNERLSRDPLPLGNAVSILRDVARALAFAHERGVVHRDIKPHNVLLSGDAAVVTDFGIAKAISAARSGTSGERSGSTTYTLAGTSLGTPAYMAPEQIAADPDLDHRADLYSFGCLAYEVIAGKTPFAGYLPQQLLTAHLGERPVPLGEKRPDCPPILVNLVMRCLEKAPSSRPQSAREILAVLEGTSATASTFDRLRNQFSSRKRRRAAAATAVVLAAAIVFTTRSRLRASEGATQVATLAVIPFNVGGDTAQEYLAEGIANELTTALGKLTGLRVVSRTLSARYRGRTDLDAREIGRDLNVGYVLHGALRPSAGRLTISAQLVDAGDNSEKWSDEFDRVADNLFEVQDSITRAISFTLSGRSSRATVATGAPASSNRGTTNPKAYDLYLIGKLALDRRGQGVQTAIARFEQAIALDSNYAQPHAGLAVALSLLPIFGNKTSIEVHDRVIASAQRALQLDSTQAEAYTALAMAHRDANEFDRALEAHRRSIQLDSTDAQSRVQYGRTLYNVRRFTAASVEFERARALDPYSSVASAWTGHLLSVLGRNDDAIVELQRALEIDSVNPPGMFMMAEALIKAGQRDSARVITERMVRTVPPWRPAAGVLYALLGDRKRAKATIREIRGAPWVVAGRFTTVAMIELALRDTSHALDALERAADEREAWMSWGALGEHHFDPVLGTARFSALLRRVGFDERSWQSSTEGRR